jgi:PAS domain S-box-containing protein
MAKSRTSKQKKASTEPNAASNGSSHLRKAIGSANFGFWEFSVKSNRIVWSDQVYKIFGLRKSEFNGTYEDFLRAIHLEDANMVASTMVNAIEKTQNYRICHRIQSKKNGNCWVECVGHVIKNKKEKVIKLAGFIRDISDEKRVEDERENWKRRYELIASSAGLVLYDYHIDSGTIDWNGETKEVLGYIREEMGDIKQWSERIHPEDRKSAVEELDKAHLRVERYDVYYRFQHKQGKYVYMHDRGLFLTGGNGKAERMLGMMNDITERKQVEQDLKESEQRFRSLQEASFGGIGLHDKGTIIDCNQGLCNISGYSHQELIGMNGLLLIVEEYRDLVLDRIIKGYEKPYDLEGIKKDGSRYALEVRGKNVPYKDRVVQVTEFRDISDRKKAEQEIHQQNLRLTSIAEDLKNKNEQLEEFTQIVSHNLRSPVGNIMTLLEFYKNATEPTEREEYFALLNNSSKTMLNTLQELSDVLKVKQNTTIERQHLRFDEIFQAVRLMLHAKIVQLRANVTTDFQLAPALHYPRIYLESILLNLLSNSIKYARPEVTPEIRLRTYLSDKSIVLECSDNGLGIDLERYKHQLFKMHKTFHPHPESRGIGLFLVKNQIEAMGGQITVASKPNIGTTFTIIFNKITNNDE